MLHSKHIILFIINIKNIQPDISLLAPRSLQKKAELDVSPLGPRSSGSGSAPALSGLSKHCCCPAECTSQVQLMWQRGYLQMDQPDVAIF